MKKIKYIGYIYPAIMAILLNGCLTGASRPTNEDMIEKNGAGRALLKISALKNSSFSRVAARAELAISGNEMSTMVRELTVTDSSVEGRVDGIPAGKQRRFEVTVYDSLGNSRYYGASQADLPKGAVVNIPITVYRVGSSAIINGSIEEDSIIYKRDSIPETGLVAYYPFNGNANDESQNDNHGSVRGAVLTKDRFGNPQSAYHFSGKDYIEVDYAPNLDNPAAFTLCAWAKSDINGNEYSEPGFIVDMGYVADYGYGIFLQQAYNHSANGKVVSYYNNSRGLFSKNILNTAWHFYVISFNEEMLVMYVDGEETASTLSTVGEISNFPLRFGAQSKSLARFWNGAIDEIFIYNRALNPDEIKYLYNLNK